MYDELVERLRYCADSDNQCSECKYRVGSPDGSKMCIDLLMEDAADAIEELTGFVQEAERDRDEYRERLDKANDAIEVLSMKHHGDEAAIAGMKREIERMVRAEKPRWIPVTERLPEEKRDGFSEDVLMLVENPDGDITWKDVFVGYYLYDATSAETGWWATMTCDCVKIGEHKYGDKVFPANEYVTHWMPLPPAPEPPKEET